MKKRNKTQPPDQVDLRDDGIKIDLPSREEIESALKYLKNNKAAGADSIAAKRKTKVGGCIRRGDAAGLDERDTT
jgi:hypothetical protein